MARATTSRQRYADRAQINRALIRNASTPAAEALRVSPTLWGANGMRHPCHLLKSGHTRAFRV